MYAAWLLALVGTAAAAPLNDNAQLIRDGGQQRSFRIAQDELEGADPWDQKSKAKRVIRRTAAQLAAHASDLERTSGRPHDLVLYEEGQPQTVATRRVLTRKVLVQAEGGFDPASAATAIHASGFIPAPHATGYFIFTVKEAGEALTVLDTLRALPGVLSAEPLLAKMHSKRLIPNDTFFSYNATGYQWHLRNTGQNGGTSGIDVNVLTTWDTYKGAGVRIGIVDDGLEVSHPDLSPNADTVNDHDWNDATPNDPTGDPSADTHGTACAGVAGARGNNGTGVCGSAFNATLVGLRLIAGNVSDQDEADALSWKSDIISIYSNSWGPDDDAKDLNDCGPLVKQAFINGAATGRGGKGTIWMWAAGNGGDVNDNSNYDGYANSIYAIAIGAMNDTGVRSDYSEPGANVVVVAPSDDSTGNHQGITTTTTNGGYEHAFGGTSSATPLAAGVVALVLQANPNLGWRDVQEILIRSARKVNPGHADWINNSAGYHFNHEYGAGLIDAQAAVTMALTWTNLTAQTSQTFAQTGLSVAIPDNNATGVTRTFAVPASPAMRTEQVTVQVTATHARRGDLEVTLTAPSGTVSKLFLAHTADTHSGMNWTFSSRRHWGETAAGNWTVKVADRRTGTLGTLTATTLKIYGTNTGAPAQPPVVSSAGSASGTVGQVFSYQITASNNPTSFGATNLPAGLSVNASGLINGTPSASGTFNTIDLTATNSAGTGHKTLTLTISPAAQQPPVITSALTATGTVGQAFSYQITATNSPASFGATSLPSGLSVNGTGLISGTPAGFGTSNVGLSATNGGGTDNKTLVLTINAVPSTLADAIDAPQFIVTTGGNLNWTAQTSSTHDNVDAAKSGAIGNDQQTWIETTVNGPGYVSFEYLISSEDGYDFFTYTIDGVETWSDSGDYPWTRVGFYVPTGTHTLRWTYAKDGTQTAGTDSLCLDQVTFSSLQQMLSDTLDLSTLTWSMTGNGYWFLEDYETHDGVDAMRTPSIAASQSTSIETTVMGPGTVTFYWQVSSEANNDKLRFEVDGVEQSAISGTVAFQFKTFNIASGVHVMRWRYSKNTSVNSGKDAGWVDQVTYTPNLASGPAYTQWLGTKFLTTEQGNAFTTGPTADPDGDGRTNAAEYAFGGNPKGPDIQTNGLAPQQVSSEAHFTYTVDTSRADLTITPQTGDAPNGPWTNATNELVSTAGSIQTRRVRLTLGVPAAKFFHLQATVAP